MATKAAARLAQTTPAATAWRVRRRASCWARKLLGRASAGRTGSAAATGDASGVAAAARSSGSTSASARQEAPQLAQRTFRPLAPSLASSTK